MARAARVPATTVVSLWVMGFETRSIQIGVLKEAKGVCNRGASLAVVWAKYTPCVRALDPFHMLCQPTQ